MSGLAGIFGISPETEERLKRAFGGDAAPAPPQTAPQQAAAALQHAATSAPALKPVMAPGGTGVVGGAPPVNAADPPLRRLTTRAENAAETAAAAGDGPDPSLPEPENPFAGQTPGVAIPAHWQGDHRKKQVEYGIDPASLATSEAARNAGTGFGLQAATARYEAALHNESVNQDLMAARAQIAKQAAARQEELAIQRQNYVEGEKAKLGEMATRLQADPTTQYWKEKGVGGSVLAGLAVALGAVGASMTGGPNRVLDMVEGQINKSINAKRAAYADAKDVFSQNVAEFGDRARAIEATKVAHWDAVAQMLEGQKAFAKTKEQQANFLELKQRLLERRAESLDNFAKLTHNKVTAEESEKFVPAAVVGGSQLGDTGKDHLYIPSLKGFATSDEAAKHLHEHAERTAVLGNTLEHALKIIEEAEKVPAYDLPTKRKLQKKLDGLSNEAATKRTVKEGQGAQSAGDKEISDAVNGILGTNLYLDPHLPGGGLANTKELIKDAQRRAQQEHRIVGEMYGIQQGQLAPSRDAKGNVVFRRQLNGSMKPVSKETQNHDDLINKLPPSGKK